MKKLLAGLLAFSMMLVSMPVGVKATDVVEVDSYEELLDALENDNANIKMTADITGTATESNGYGKTGIVLDGGDVLDGNGHTLTINGANNTWDSAIAMKGGEVKNLTIAGAFRGVFMPGAKGDVVIDNCVFKDVVYTFNSDDGSKDYTVTIKNSVLNGWTSFSNVHKSVTFENCTFGEGSGYSFLRPYQPTSFIDCEFEEGFELDTSKTADNEIEFTDCTYNGESLSSDNNDMFYNGGSVIINGQAADVTQYVAKVGEKGYLTLQAVFEDTTLTGDVTITINDTVTWETGAAHGSTPFNVNDNVTSITLVGAEGKNATFKATGAGVGPVGHDTIPVTFKNLTIVDESVSYAENSWEFGYLEFRGTTKFENVEFTNAIMMSGESASFIECSFNSNKDSEYAVWVDNGSATFTDCTFTGARGLKVHEAYGSEVATVTVEDCTFKELTKKPGVALGTLNANTEINLSNNLFIDCQPGDQGLYIYETDTEVENITFTSQNNKVSDVHDLTHVSAKKATYTETGNIEYWYCSICDKYYTDADGLYETTKEATVIPMLTMPYIPSADVEAVGVDSEDEVDVDTVTTAKAVREALGRKNILATIEVGEADDELVEVTYDAGRDYKNETIYVLQWDGEEFTLVDTVEADKRGDVVFTVEGDAEYILSTVLPEETEEPETPVVYGWVETEEGWKFYDYATGEQRFGWAADGKNWYFINKETGIMLENDWIAQDSTGAVWYYVGADGAMVRDVTVDGYYIDANGEWRA